VKLYNGTHITPRMCLENLGVLKKEDDTAVVTRVFWRYASFHDRLR